MLVRALIVLLSILNLGVAAWWVSRDPAPAAPPVEPPLGVMKLQLSHESAPAPSVPQTLARSAAPSMPTPASAERRAAPMPQECFSFGPFANRQAADAAAARLRPTVRRLVAREADAATRGWRVFVPPLASLQDAQAAALRIATAGFSDFMVVREGPEANSVALGRYRNETGARARAQALTDAGFEVRVEPVEPRDESSTAIWLDVIAGEAFDPRRAQATITARQHRVLDCAALR